METIKEKKVINLNFNLSLGKLQEHNWVRFVIFVFAITPFIFSFGFKRISFLSSYNELWEIIVFSIIMQIPILIIGIPLYILYLKNKYPEKISERRYEFQVSKFKTLHYFFSSFWLNGFVGTCVFLICLIFGLSQTWFLLLLYGFIVLRLLIIAIYYYSNKNNVSKIIAL